VALEFTYAPLERLVRVNATGHIPAEEVLAFWQELISDPTITPGSQMLVVVRDASTSMRTQDLEPLMKHYGAVVTKGIERLVIAAADDAMYGMSRAFAVFAERWRFDVRVFRSEVEALAWLQEVRPASERGTQSGDETPSPA
jgi:hypothetical protein